MLKFICYSKCSTCNRARKWLDDHQVQYEVRDIKGEHPTQAELTKWYQMSGLPLKRFFNTSGMQYRALSLKDKLPDMSEEEQLALLSTGGMLVKRPLLIGENLVLVGFKQAEWEEKLN